MNNFNIRNIVLVLLIVMLSSFALAGMLGGVALNFDNWGSFGGPVENVDIERTFAVGELTEISANTVSTDLNIISTESDEIKVHLYGSTSAHAVPELLVSERTNRLEVKVEPRRNIRGTIHYRLKLDIYVPADYTGSIEFRTVSGDFNIDAFTLDRLAFNSVSGNMKADSLTAGETVLKTTSGGIKITGNPGSLEVKTISGSISAAYSDFNSNINIGTTSGAVKIQLPAAAGFNLQAESVSGRINSDFPVTVTESSGRNRLSGTAGDGGQNITVKTVSGNITLSQ